jgi:hypothetical protein
MSAEPTTENPARQGRPGLCQTTSQVDTPSSPFLPPPWKRTWHKGRRGIADRDVSTVEARQIDRHRQILVTPGHGDEGQDRLDRDLLNIGRPAHPRGTEQRAAADRGRRALPRAPCPARWGRQRWPAPVSHVHTGIGLVSRYGTARFLVWNGPFHTLQLERLQALPKTWGTKGLRDLDDEVGRWAVGPSAMPPATSFRDSGIRRGACLLDG